MVEFVSDASVGVCVCKIWSESGIHFTSNIRQLGMHLQWGLSQVKKKNALKLSRRDILLPLKNHY